VNVALNLLVPRAMELIIIIITDHNVLSSKVQETNLGVGKDINPLCRRCLNGNETF
jgi:hypothetical protein